MVIDGEPNPAGNRLLASFNVALPSVLIRGCTLIEKADGIVHAYGPKGKTHRGYPSSAELTDVTLQRAITRRAAVIYSAYTGREVSDE